MLVQNETVFAARSPRRRRRPPTWCSSTRRRRPTYTKPAPYGAGHCNFTTDELTGSVTALDGWVRGGVYPTGPAVTAAFGSDPGSTSATGPGPWPAVTS